MNRWSCGMRNTRLEPRPKSLLTRFRVGNEFGHPEMDLCNEWLTSFREAPFKFTAITSET